VKSGKRRVSVALYWVHPLVLAEFRRLLPWKSFRLTECRIVPGARGAVALPVQGTEEIAVLDADLQAPVTKNLVAAIHESRPGTRLVVLAEGFDEELAFRLLRLGAKGLLTYRELVPCAARALAAVAEGGFWAPRALLSRFVDAALRDGSLRRAAPEAGRLTAREREVYEDLLENLSNKEIARKRNMTARTAQFHVSNVLAKYGVKRRADLLLALRA
jgi:DNA-binding NarL/FixJ family response regulator